MSDQIDLNNKISNVTERIVKEIKTDIPFEDLQILIKGLVSYYYLSEQFLSLANEILEPDGVDYTMLNEKNWEDAGYIDEVKAIAIEEIGYYIMPGELFQKLNDRVYIDEELNTNLMKTLIKLFGRYDSKLTTPFEEIFININKTARLINISQVGHKLSLLIKQIIIKVP